MEGLLLTSFQNEISKMSYHLKQANFNQASHILFYSNNKQTNGNLYLIIKLETSDV